MALTDLTPADLETAAKAESAFLVEIWSTACPNCRVQAAMLERMEPEYSGHFRFGRLCFDAYPEIADRFRIRTLPSLLLFRPGALPEVLPGFKPAPALRQILNSCIDPNPQPPPP